MSQIYIRGSRVKGMPTAVGGLYDFSNDAGAVGSISTGVRIPALAIIHRFNVKVITAPTSGGSATISFGWSGFTNSLMVANGVAAFVANTVLLGIDFNANPTMASTTFGDATEVLMTIAVAALTAGKLAFEVEFTEYDM